MPDIKKLLAKMNRDIDIKRDCYAMATVDGDSAEVLMYGDVVEERPVDWWTGEEISGNFIILSEFLEDLDALSKCKNITLRINSVGGSVHAALPIYNRLNELKANITAIVDGVSMSAASFIMCAADTIKVSETSLVMIHRAAVVIWAWMNADNCRELADTLDKYDTMIAAAYAKKTGMSEDDVLTLMSDETYMTGKEALDMGFADELVEDAEELEIAASADRQTLFVNGREMRLPFALSKLPENIITVKPDAGSPAADKTNIKQPGDTGNQEGGTQMYKNLEELKAQAPELYETLMTEARTAVSGELGNETSEAVAAERKRLKDIDEVASQFDDETVRNAKYGDKPITAQEMVYAAAVKASKDGRKFMAALEGDAKDSGAQDVPAAPGATETTAVKTDEQMMAEAKAVVADLLGKKEGK